ncbi:hypothetical protein EW146_g6293 [Bondarzewia mesenterica]|uniref:C2H2-type domain-containing protein n=1 Tax=Bondarzewia mesenterica TaxID=1095465 RepID=A0A4S4LUQ3_9AGAM|nr:hypothetical protein EW146_g6293 [Bondarzewia mesenterica]
MSVYCPGCRSLFGEGAFTRHIRTTQDPRCVVIREHHRALTDPDSSFNKDTPVPFDDANPAFCSSFPLLQDPFTDAEDNFGWGQEDDEAIHEDPADPFAAANDDLDMDEEEDLPLDYQPAAQVTLMSPSNEITPMDDDELEQLDREMRIQDEEHLWCEPTVVHFGGNAGTPIQDSGTSAYLEYDEELRAKFQACDGNNHCAENPWEPFGSKLNWEFARWAKMRGPSLNAISELLRIEGVQDRLQLSYKTTQELNTRIDKHFLDVSQFDCKTICVDGQAYEVYFRNVLQCIEMLYSNPDFLPSMVFAPERHYADEDMTICMYHQMHTAKEVRCKPSKQGHILIGYLPTARLGHITNDDTRRRAVANLFHAYMWKILQPIRSVGIAGVAMASSDGVVHRCHPIFAAYVGDYPEQVLVTCTKMGDCPKCLTSNEDLGSNTTGDDRSFINALDALSAIDRGPAAFIQACEDAGIKPVYHPFWEDLPYANIFQLITPDILHQLHQGIEHKDICRILLGLIIGLSLPGGRSPVRVVRAVRALLDFLYLAQYPSHTETTLSYMEDALKCFHANKNVFVEMGIWENFKLPKLHSLDHYAPSIQLFGTADNFNTEYSERLHIDLAKDAYRSTNHKDEYTQMTLWLQWHEKVLRHDKFLAWHLAGRPLISNQKPLRNERQLHIHVARYPNAKSVSFTSLAANHGAVDFHVALAEFIIQLRNPNLSTEQARKHALKTTLPFKSVAVYHRVKFWNPDAQGCQDVPETLDMNVGGGGESGVEGYRVAQVRVIFSLPIKAARSIFPPNLEVPTHLAYIEWFSPFPPTAEENHLLYKVSRSYHSNGHRYAAVIALDQIQRSVHLFPRCGPTIPRHLLSSTVLDKCDSFFVSSFTDRHTYITLY